MLGMLSDLVRLVSNADSARSVNTSIIIIILPLSYTDAVS